MTALPIHDFAPITLTELLAEAELLTRFDRKYLLDQDQAAALLRGLDPRTRVLAIDGRRCFRYESVYFDTPDLLSYRQAAHARRHRLKVRTRSYLDSDLAFLEVKVRGDRDVTVKDRVDYDLDRRDQLTASGRHYAESTLDQRGMDGSVARQLAPTLITRYERVTLLPPEPGVRVTIDTNLSWRSAGSPNAAAGKSGDGGHKLPPDGSDRQTWQPEPVVGNFGTNDSLALPDLVIVETKSGPRPSGVDRLLWRRGHRPISISKYGTGLAALRGELPSNKWARVLRNHFHLPEELMCAA